MKKLITLSAFLLLTFSMVHANDASFLGDGATVYANKENRVRMVKEVIHISEKILPEGKRDPRDWIADCTFTFENLSDEKISLTMGFPNWEAFGDGIEIGSSAIADFVVEINTSSLKICTSILTTSTSNPCTSFCIIHLICVIQVNLTE